MITSLFVIDKELGPQDESTFDNHKNLTALLLPDADAGLEIDAGDYNLIVRDTLDSLIIGICIEGVRALEKGGAFTNVSFAGYPTTEVIAVDDMAQFSTEGKTISMQLELAIHALRQQAERFGVILKKVYPDNLQRAQEFLDFAAGK